ncbi:MAG: hypothetical protein ACRD0J_17025, partial [Acidimicrobiales bacterium]
MEAQHALLEGLMSVCEADEDVLWLVIGCSLARGAGDSLSDLDVAIGVRDEELEPTLARLGHAVDHLGTLVDSLHRRLPGLAIPHRRVFAQYADGGQVDLLVCPASAQGASVPDAVVLYDAEHRLVSDGCQEGPFPDPGRTRQVAGLLPT